MSALAPSAVPLREALRRATAARHTALDARLSGAMSDLAGYTAFLRGTARFRGGIETALTNAGVSELLQDWRRRVRAPLLLGDLRSLGEPAPPAPAAPPPRVASGDDARLLGIAYVLEGSVLGGAFLAAHAGRLGMHGGRGASYLASCAGARRDWRAFLARLEAVDTPRFDRAAATRAANEAFDFAAACY